MSSTAVAARLPVFRLLVLSGAIFVVITNEFLPVGLLTGISADLRIPESQTGLLVGVFAATVVVTAAPLTALTRRWPRRPLLVGMLLLMAGSVVLTGIADDYAVLVVSRILGAIGHGLFWAITAPYAARMVPPQQVGRAVAITAFGNTAAFVLGVPAITALGSVVGWRPTTLIVAGALAVFAGLIAVLLPSIGGGDEQHPAAEPGERSPIGAIVLLLIALVLVMSGQYAYYTFITAWTAEAGYDVAGTSTLLLVFGLAGALGVVAVGALIDRFPRATPPALLLVLALAVGTLALGSGMPWAVVIGMVLWGVGFGGLPALFQTRLLQLAPRRWHDVASALLTTAFNIGIGSGAAVGALAVETTGVMSLPVVQLVFTLVALVLIGWMSRARR